MSDFVVIPGYPNHSVNALGQVRNHLGVSLRHDPYGRVSLRKDGKTTRFHVGELLALAGLMGGGPLSKKEDK